jgi:KUP system potassium uptake protein
MITPAISVLSAVEGLEIATPAFAHFVLPITILILVGLFMLQRRGTAGIGSWFGPVTLVWLLVLLALGLRQIVLEPAVLSALLPWHAARFLWTNGASGLLVLGAVFLVVTGTEALYADMGHFGRRPIRLAWFVLVLPALLCNYFGQGALLLAHPELSEQPFYALAPHSLLVPLVVLATLATIIASQAVISGAFSLTRQAIQLGYCPRMTIVHTSAEEIGQVYVAEINWLLMVSTIALVLGFQSSGHLAAAYGVAVTTTMVISTVLFYVLARERWGWSRLKAGLPVALFLLVDLAFFGSNMTKIAHGAWFPLAVAAGIFVLMTTWKRGRYLLLRRFRSRALTLEDFLEKLPGQRIPRVEGYAVFLNSDAESVPAALLHNLKHNRILHQHVAVLTVISEQVPRVPRGRKLEVEELGQGFVRLVAHYGFMEEADVKSIFALARDHGLELHPAEVSFFLGRERVLPSKRPGMALWRDHLFAALSRNALSATAYYGIPPDRVVELGSQVEI